MLLKKHLSQRETKPLHAYSEDILRKILHVHEKIASNQRVTGRKECVCGQGHNEVR